MQNFNDLVQEEQFQIWGWVVGGGRKNVAYIF